MSAKTASGRVVGTTEHQQGVFDNDVDGGEEEVANILNGWDFAGFHCQAARLR